jgi:hypothetical protein
MTKSKPAAKPAAKRPTPTAPRKAQPAGAAKAAAGDSAHEHVELTAPFEVHDANGFRTFKPGPRSLPKALAAEARRRGLVAAAKPE